MWIQRLVDKQNTFSFAYLTSFLPKIKFNEMLSSSFNSKSLNKEMPTFYKDILTHWFDTRRKPIDTMDIVDEVIWYNKNIVIDNSMIFYQNFYAKNILRIIDLLDENGQFMNIQELRQKYNLNTNFLTLQCIISAIPGQWKQHIRHNFTQQIFIDSNANKNLYLKSINKDITITKTSSKELYWHFISKTKTNPSCIVRWRKEFIFLKDDEWSEIFKKNNKITKNIKIQMLNYKIIHKNYASKHIVAKFDRNINPMCTTCNTPQDISHTFIYCKNVDMLWNLLENWLKRAEFVNQRFTLNKRMKL